MTTITAQSNYLKVSECKDIMKHLSMLMNTIFELGTDNRPPNSQEFKTMLDACRDISKTNIFLNIQRLSRQTEKSRDSLTNTLTKREMVANNIGNKVACEFCNTPLSTNSLLRHIYESQKCRDYFYNRHSAQDNKICNPCVDNQNIIKNYKSGMNLDKHHPADIYTEFEDFEYFNNFFGRNKFSPEVFENYLSPYQKELNKFINSLVKDYNIEKPTKSYYNPNVFMNEFSYPHLVFA